MYKHSISNRNRLVVLGGGIHGVGVLHDLVSRGWKDIHLFEKSTLAGGTSSKSTKLIHGGLRYLKRISQFNLVSESLTERKFLLNIAPDIVQPIELLLPINKGDGFNGMVMKTGLFLYDILASSSKIKSHTLLNNDQVIEKASALNLDNVRKVFSFWDAQTDDLALVNRVAESAVNLGASITEKCEVTKLCRHSDGWQIEVKEEGGKVHTITSMYIINCLGPWANRFLDENNIETKVQGINNKGIHLLYDDIGLKSGLFLPAKTEDRFVFMLPWKGYTLIGTTEMLFNGNPDDVEASDSEVQYLIDQCNQYMKNPLERSGVINTFSGLRWLAAERTDISSTSREATLDEVKSERGLLITLYGGKLTSYRSLSKKIGDRICAHFGEFIPSATDNPKNWVQPGNVKRNITEIEHRFVSNSQL